MPADKDWIYDPSRNPYHSCPAHHQVNLVSWRLEVSEIELTYDDTENNMIIDGHNLPCYFAEGFCKPTTKTSFTLVWFSDDLCSIFTLQDFIGRMTKLKIDIGLKQTLSYILQILKNLIKHRVLNEHHLLKYMLHIHKIHTIPIFHVLKYFRMLKHFVAHLILSILHITLINL